jgi:drug/metabolite transporter (DMT)-like permease
MWLRLILLAFMMGGISDTIWKLFAEITHGTGANTYLFVFHLAVLVCAGLLVIMRKKKIRMLEAGYGFLIGITLGTGGILSMQALIRLPGIVYFPIINGCSLILVAVFARIFWKEKLERRQLIGLIIACASVVLIAWK